MVNLVRLLGTAASRQPLVLIIVEMLVCGLLASFEVNLLMGTGMNSVIDLVMTIIELGLLLMIILANCGALKVKLIDKSKTK